MTTMTKKIDTCIWAKHVENLPAAGFTATITYNGTTKNVKFVPMAKNVKGFKPDGENKEFWTKIPYGAEITFMVDAEVATMTEKVEEVREKAEVKEEVKVEGEQQVG